jgi:hypothetical protein
MRCWWEVELDEGEGEGDRDPGRDLLTPPRPTHPPVGATIYLAWAICLVGTEVTPNSGVCECPLLSKHLARVLSDGRAPAAGGGGQVVGSVY